MQNIVCRLFTAYSTAAPSSTTNSPASCGQGQAAYTPLGHTKGGHPGVVRHTPALFVSATASSKQAHNHTSRHHSYMYQHHPSREFPLPRANHPHCRPGDLPAVQPWQMLQGSRALLCPQVLGHRLWWRPLLQGLPTCCISGLVSSSELIPMAT